MKLAITDDMKPQKSLLEHAPRRYGFPRYGNFYSHFPRYGKYSSTVWKM